METSPQRTASTLRLLRWLTVAAALVSGAVYVAILILYPFSWTGWAADTIPPPSLLVLGLSPYAGFAITAWFLPRTRFQSGVLLAATVVVSVSGLAAQIYYFEQPDILIALLILGISWTQLYALIVVVAAVGLVRAISWLRQRRDEQARTGSHGAH